MDRERPDRIEAYYRRAAAAVAAARGRMQRPLALTEKIIFGHMWEGGGEAPARGKSALCLYPDRVAMQDATAQMAMLQFILLELDQSRVPVTIHCDHLITVAGRAAEDLSRALVQNEEVYNCLRSAAARFGLGFWEPGSGIIHQIVLEGYAFPGGLLIGTDSHTPNAGGLGMLAVGVGGADAVEVMAGEPFRLNCPKLIGVRLKNRLSGWAAPKDLILRLAGALTVSGGTGKVIEYFGPGTESLSCTGKATVCNMGAELGATASIFPYDERMSRYLAATGRGETAGHAETCAAELRADPEVELDPERVFDQLVEIDLSALEPGWVGPHTPDLYTPASKMAERVRAEDLPDEISAALIGSCTNSSYEDLSRAAAVAREALRHGLKAKVPFYVTPGSRDTARTAERDGLMQALAAFGAEILPAACGPCIGQWQRAGLNEGVRNTIVTSYNRNFRGRNDGNPETLCFIGSPELVTAAAAAGRLSFNPVLGEIAGITLAAPAGEELPARGFEQGGEGFTAPPEEQAARSRVRIEIDPKSERLERLPQFAPWDGRDLCDLLLLVKAKGKCTTDHISPAGKWLKYRGHLSRISANLFSGAVNAFSGAAGTGMNVLTGDAGAPFAETAAEYKRCGAGWIAVGEENYGEGSSREHAALEPRHLGGVAVIAKSFARLHEANLKKQGVLPLTFKRASDYELIGERDRFDLSGVAGIAPGSTLKLRIRQEGRTEEVALGHALNAEEIEWFKAGSALNWLRLRAKEGR